MFTKFDEIPTLPVQVIKEKSKCLTELAPSSYFSIINVHLVDINMFVKFFEIPPLPFQDIEIPMCSQNLMIFLHCLFKEKPKRCGLRITKGNNSTSPYFAIITKGNNSTSPYFAIINVHLVDINVFAKFYEIPSLPFQDIEKPKRRGQTLLQRAITLKEIL